MPSDPQSASHSVAQVEISVDGRSIPAAHEVIGRHAEIAAAGHFLDHLASGPAAFVINGEAGIGKTALWEAIVADASARGLMVLEARPAEAEADLSLTGLADLFGGQFDAIAPWMPPPQRRALEVALLRSEPGATGVDARVLGAAVLTALSRLSRDRAVVVAIDDVEWLDRSTDRLIDFAIRRLRDQAVGLLVARRPPTASGWTRTVATAMSASRTTTIEVGPMSLAALHRLVEARTGETLTRPMLTRLESASGGNPFLALEIVASLLRRGSLRSAEAFLPAPADVRQLVAARVAGLPPASIEVLLAIALLGRPEIEELAAALPEQELDARLGEAVDAGLIAIEGRRARFRHPLYGSAVYAGATSTQRRRLHRRLAEVTSSPEESARHLALGTDVPDEPTASRLTAASDAAAARGAPDAAASLIEHALRLTPSTPVTRRGRRGLTLAHYLWEVGDVARSRAVADEAVGLLPRGPDRALGRLLLAAQASWTEGAEQALEQCRLALDDAGPDRILESKIRLRMAYITDMRPRVAAEHTSAALRALDGLETGAPPELLACLLLYDAELRRRAGEDVGEDVVARGRALLPAPPDPPDPALGLHVLGMARERDWLLRELADDLVGARDALVRLYEHDRDAGLDRVLPIMVADLAEIECLLGDLPAARAHAATAAELAAQTGRTPFGDAFALLATARVAAHEGRLSEAERAAAAGEALADGLADEALGRRFVAIRAFGALCEGRSAEAAAELARLRTALEIAGVLAPSALRFRGDEIEALVHIGDLDAARQRLADLQAGRPATPWTDAVGARSAALVATADGDLEAALRLLAAALHHHARLPIPLELGRTLLLKGQVHRRRREKRLAADAIGEALATFERISAAAWADRARQEIARTGLRPSAPDDLTATEAEVARLAASGLSNRQVADALVLSPKSIDGVLLRVYRKLGIHTRAELGARMTGDRKR